MYNKCIIQLYLIQRHNDYMPKVFYIHTCILLPIAMQLLRYTRYCICDMVPPCRVHAMYVHLFTIIRFLKARANIHTVLEG